MTAATAAAETFDPAATMGIPEPAGAGSATRIAPGTPLWHRTELAMRGRIKLGGFQLRRHR
jgi:hypothetical protein